MSRNGFRPSQQIYLFHSWVFFKCSDVFVCIKNSGYIAGMSKICVECIYVDRLIVCIPPNIRTSALTTASFERSQRTR